MSAGQENQPKETYESYRVKKELSRRFDVVFIPDTENDYNEYSIRQVDSHQMGKYVTIKGIVTRVGEMLPMMRVATYLCRTCGFENYQRVIAFLLLHLLLDHQTYIHSFKTVYKSHLHSEPQSR